MSETEVQKVETVMFHINHGDDSGLAIIWKDGSLYLSISTLLLTDGKEWYSIPFKSLRDISMSGEGCIVLKMEGVEIKIKGKNAERLMALRHLLLPLIERRPDEDIIIEDIIKLMLIGINEVGIIASILKKDPEEIRDLIDEGVRKGYISEGKVTEKGKLILPEDEIESMKKAGVNL